jgi:hypothetical protein
LERKVSTRKFVKISEIDSSGAIHNVFEWNLSNDVFQQTLNDSFLLSKIAKNLDVPLSLVMQELERRKQILLEMVNKNLRDFRSVHNALSSSVGLTGLVAESKKEA